MFVQRGSKLAPEHSSPAAVTRAQPQAPKLEVVEFAAFQCPSCRRFALLYWPAVQARLGNKVDLRFRHWPQSYHRDAFGAALAAVCAGRHGRFQGMHDLLFREQDLIGRKSFESFARESGIRNL